LLSVKKLTLSDIQRVGGRELRRGELFYNWEAPFNCLAFPFLDYEDGHVIGAIFRNLENGGLKWKSTSFKKHILYGLYWSLPAIVKRDTAIIVEGVFDFIALRKYCENVVASLGTLPTERQLYFLARFARKLIIFADEDVSKDKVKRDGVWKKFHVSFVKGSGDPDELAAVLKKDLISFIETKRVWI